MSVQVIITSTCVYILLMQILMSVQAVIQITATSWQTALTQKAVSRVPA